MADSLNPSDIPSDQVWIVIAGFLISFVLAFAVGANDVANAFGTSVGSKVLTLRWACILGTIFETAGALLVGAKVSGTIRSGIVDTPLYANQPELLMLGQLSSLVGCAVWLMIATFFKLPVSTTHSIVGATVGFTLVAKGFDSVIWKKIITIAISWVTSPVLSGVVSVALFWLCKRFVITAMPSPLEAGLRALPLIYGLTVTVNAFSIIASGPTVLYFDRIPTWGNFVASCGLGLLLSVLIKTLLVPHQRLSIRKYLWKIQMEDYEFEKVDPTQMEMKPIEYTETKNGHAEPVYDTQQETPIQKFEDETNEYGVVNSAFAKDEGSRDNDDDTASYMSECSTCKDNEMIKKGVHDPPAVARMFTFCQVLTSCFISFAHGGNDVANSIGPLVGIWILSITQDIDSKAGTPYWILLYGGAGMSIGLWVWGRRVMETVGTSLTVVTPSSGFTINFGAALTVLLASNIGIPVSTTHCIVGAVVCVGRFRSRDNIDWKLFVNIVLSWVVTLPAAIGLSAFTMFFLMQLYTNYALVQL